MELLILLSRSSSSSPARSCSRTASSGSGGSSGWPRARSGRCSPPSGTALPETMIPIVAILFSRPGALGRDRRRRDPGRAVHARDAGDVRDRPRGHVPGPPPARGRRHARRHARPRHGHADVRRHLRLAIAAARLPAERPDLAEDRRRDRAVRGLRLVREGPLRGRPVGRRRGPRAAPLPSVRRRPHRRRPTAPRACERQPAGASSPSG